MTPPDQVWKIVSLQDAEQTYFSYAKQSGETARINTELNLVVLSFYLNDLPENMRANLYKSANYDVHGTNDFIKNLPTIQSRLSGENGWASLPNINQTWFNSMPQAAKNFFSSLLSWF